jgi:ferritin
MMKDSVLTALNKQIRHEQTNAHAYHAVSLYFGRLNLHGLQAFMAAQARDERRHASRLIRHAADRGGQVELGSIPAPRTEFASPSDAVRAVLDMERATTGSIHRLYQLARDEADHALEVALHWFINEQVEEEQWAGELAHHLEQVHDLPGEMLRLDHRWGERAKGGRR